jgi:DNA-binding transcriptional MerR regulator
MYEMDLYLSVADASRLLDVTPQMVRLMVRQGVLTVAARTVGGIKLFRREEVERLVAVRRAAGRSPAHSDEERVTHGEPT